VKFIATTLTLVVLALISGCDTSADCDTLSNPAPVVEVEKPVFLTVADCDPVDGKRCECQIVEDSCPGDLTCRQFGEVSYCAWPVSELLLPCDTDLDCERGFVCNGGETHASVKVCVYGCKDDTDCLGNEVCELESGALVGSCEESFTSACQFEQFDGLRYRVYIPGYEVTLSATYIAESCELLLEEEQETKQVWTYILSQNESGEVEAYGVFAGANGGAVVVKHIGLTRISIEETTSDAYGGGIKNYDFILIP